MCRRDVLMIGLIAVLTGSLFSSSGAADQNARTHGYGLGQPATEQDIQPWNIDVAPTGEGLPPGRGTTLGPLRLSRPCGGVSRPVGLRRLVSTGKPPAQPGFLTAPGGPCRLVAETVGAGLNPVCAFPPQPARRAASARSRAAAGTTPGP